MVSELLCIMHKNVNDLARGRLGTGTFRAQDLSFARTNRPYGELSFPRLRSWELSFPGSFPGPFVPRNFRSQDFSFPGTLVPPTILQGIRYERRQL